MNPYSKGQAFMKTKAISKNKSAYLSALSIDLSNFLRGQYSENTIKNYRNDLEDWLQFIGKPINQARVKDALRYLTYLKERGLKPSTINRRISALRTLYGFLEAVGQAEFNPFDPRLIKGLKTRTQPPLGLSRHEVRRLLMACEDGTIRGLRDKAILLLGLVALLRRSEIANLKWGDLREEGGYRMVLIRSAKGGPEQKVFLREDVWNAIMEYQRKLQITYGVSPDPDTPVFRALHNHKGIEKGLSDRMIDYIVKSRAEKGLIKKKISAHSLRHTGITLALQSGAPLDRVMAHARHKNPRTTIGYHRAIDTFENSAAEFIRW